MKITGTGGFVKMKITGTGGFVKMKSQVQEVL
jgi:hypothetical protein